MARVTTELNNTQIKNAKALSYGGLDIENLLHKESDLGIK